MPASSSPTKAHHMHHLRPDTQNPPEQATLTFLPPQILPALAQEANVSVDSLSTLTVPSGTLLYVAVTEYIALSSPRAPLFSDTVENISDSSSDEEERSSVQAFRNKFKSKSPLIKQRPSVPQFRLALGLAHAVWPPPQHITADALVREKGKIPYSAVPCLKDEKEDDVNTCKSFHIHVANYAVGSPDFCNSGTTYREILIGTSEHSDVLRKFAKDVCKWHFEKEGQKPRKEGRFIVLRYYGKWRAEGWKRSRPENTVILANGMLQDILDDASMFLNPNTKKWYNDHGIPQRRCYLFHGPSGTGKTSTIRVLASKFNLACCYLSLAMSGFDDENIADAISTLPERCLVVIEDIDALFNADRENPMHGAVTFSGLLNALDGLTSTEGVLTILTTNKMSRLDKALVRGGRVDRRFSFERPTDVQLRDLFLSFYPDAEERVVKIFLRTVLDRNEDDAKTISTLQELFIKMRDKSAEECAVGVTAFYDKYLPEQEDQRYIYV